ncbi:MAG: O-antigen ligase domain-containing protein, partial [Tolypothrix sp. Co-bin9]|nr:O-antigen ligase domain-containing protein [Tolypothrix sp. Co-bin9]
MTSKQILFNPFLKENYSPEERSLQGWIVISCFLLISLAFYLGPAASLRLIYPIIALVTAVFLYLRHPILYLGFTWWMWFLSPLFTRLVDLKVGWDPTRQMLVAPYLVVFVTIGTLFRYLPSAYRQGGLPFILAFAGVFYGFLVGLVQNPPVPVARNLLDWLIPLLFGFHLFINWRDYPSYRQNIQRTFLWCVLILGVYGIFQFVVAPEWDRY